MDGGDITEEEVFHGEDEPQPDGEHGEYRFDQLTLLFTNPLHDLTFYQSQEPPKKDEDARGKHQFLNMWTYHLGICVPGRSKDMRKKGWTSCQSCRL
jgi:hypothetical protein